KSKLLQHKSNGIYSDPKSCAISPWLICTSIKVTMARADHSVRTYASHFVQLSFWVKTIRLVAQCLHCPTFHRMNLHWCNLCSLFEMNISLKLDHELLYPLALNPNK